jgi:L-alanine-DL-glutamate epimerase-like enolase superfamily enzyme
MKVAKLETWRCRRGEELFDAARQGRAPMDWDVVVLRLETDEGVAGEATAIGARSSMITQQYLHELIAPIVLGRSVHDREAIYHELWNIDRHLTFFPVYLPGPVDVALYDAAAKAAGLPLYQYLGANRDRLPVYASSLWLPDPEAYVREASRYAARGIRAYKAHPPGPWRRDLEVHEALRAAMGPDYVLMSDPVAEYSLEEAIRVGRQLERLGYHWFEEPFRDFELDKYRKLCAALDMAVAATETTRGGPWGVAQAIKFDAVDIVRADVSWKPGITGTLKIAALAEAHGMRCELHTTTMGPTDIANLHVACAIRNSEYFELFVPEDVFRFPMKDAWPIDGEGMIHVPQGPGLGVHLDWDRIDDCCLEHRASQA